MRISALLSRLTLAAGLGATVGPEAGAGAWPQEAGRGQAIASITLDVGRGAFDDAGQLRPTVEFDKLEAALFLEHGVTDWLTLVARPAYQTVRLRGVQGAEEEASGAAATEIAIRVTGWRGRHGAFSVQGGLLAPGEVENRLNARLGDGELGGELRVLAGMGWEGWLPGFVEAQGAGRAWEGEGALEYRVDLTAGVEPAPGWLALAQSFSTWSPRDGARLAYESHKAQLSLVRRVSDRLAIQAGGMQSVAGRNVVDENAGFVSLWYSY